MPHHKIEFLNHPGSYTVEVCAAPSGLESGMVFEGTREFMEAYLSFQFQMSKKEREICEFEMDLIIFVVCALI